MMKFSTDGAKELGARLLNLEVTLIASGFGDRITVPEPKTQVEQIAESYQVARENSRVKQEAAMEKLAESGVKIPMDDIASPPTLEPALESGEVPSQGIINLFDQLALDAGNDLKRIEAAREIAEAAELPESPLGIGSEEGAAPEAGGLEAAGNGDSISSSDSMKPGDPVDFADMLKVVEREEDINRQIKHNSLQLASMMRDMQGGSAMEAAGDVDLKEVEWNPENILQVRKLWEVRPGDRIIMRTVIGLDGDVVTRINPAFVDEQYKGLHVIHNKSVDVSIGYWKNLIDVLLEFVNIIAGKLFPG